MTNMTACPCAKAGEIHHAVFFRARRRSRQRVGEALRNRLNSKGT
jgi:hypothetical protein